MHRFSIIVPMLRDHRLFDDTLASVLRNRPSNSQVIVVHDGTYEDPYGLDSEVDFVSTEQRAQLIRFFNCALRHATGELIALVRPGVELAEGWEAPVYLAFEDEEVASVTPILVAPDQPNTIVAAGVKHGGGFRRQVVAAKAVIAPRTIKRINSIGPTSWAAFYRASALSEIGTCGEQLDSSYLDLDIALSLLTLGYRNAVAAECVLPIERATLIERELVTPHGKSAQRAFQRHEHHVGRRTMSLAVIIGSELLSAPFQPWKARHAMQRLTARRMTRLDENFADQLEIRARQRQDMKAIGIRVHSAAGTKIERPVRRAA